MGFRVVPADGLPTFDGTYEGKEVAVADCDACQSDPEKDSGPCPQTLAPLTSCCMLTHHASSNLNWRQRAQVEAVLDRFANAGVREFSQGFGKVL